ncbi:MAG TPA: efflux transporter outer membrane subunit [Caulobacteraceae bacterium]|jgi:NodT family efflux transporter outer membrane factor (OMF) lipoprotein|nr:efflux transporter outer membrane subunit [Caulobacteraceae bacterium]
MSAPLRHRHAVLSLTLAGALGGCAAVGPDFVRPAPPTTPGYSAAGETGPDSQQIQLGQAVTGRWWDYFGSAELDGVMRLAVANNPSLAAADATLAAAQAQIRATQAEASPQLNGTAGISGQRLNLSSFGFDASSFPGLNPNPTFALYSVGLAASYSIDPFGLNKRQVEGASARAETLAHQADAAYLTLTGNVAVQAAYIAAARAEIATVQEIIADDQRMIELARTAQALGGEAETPRVSAQAQMAADNSRLPSLRQDLANARHALSLLVGKAPADWSPPDFDLARLTLPPRIPLSLPSELVRQRPDILAAEARLHAATADVGVATAKLYPSLDLTAALTQSNLSIPTLFTSQGTSGSLAAQLAGPLFDGGRRRAEREAMRETARAALATYQATVVQAFGQVADLLQALAQDEEALAAQGQARDAAAASLRLARAAYQGGASGLLPVVDAERQFNTARLEYVRTEAQRYVHTVQLFVATGSGLRDAKPAAPAV